MSPRRIATKKKIKESVFNSVVKRYLIEQQKQNSGDNYATNPSLNTENPESNGTQWWHSVPPFSSLRAPLDLFNYTSDALEWATRMPIHKIKPDLLKSMHPPDFWLLSAPYAIDALSKGLDYTARRWPSPYGGGPPQLSDKLWSGVHNAIKNITSPLTDGRARAPSWWENPLRKISQTVVSQLDPKRTTSGIIPRINDSAYFRGLWGSGKDLLQSAKTWPSKASTSWQDLLQSAKTWPSKASTSWQRTSIPVRNFGKGTVATVIGGLAGEGIKYGLEKAGAFDWWGEKVRESMQQTQDRSPKWMGAIQQGTAEGLGRMGAGIEKALDLDPVGMVYALGGETEAERYWREKLRDEGQAQSFWDDPLMYSIRASQETTENAARSRRGLPTGSISDRVAGDNELWKRDIQAKYPELEKQNEWERQQREANRKQDEQEQKEREAKREQDEQEQIQRERMPSGDALDLLRRKESQANY